MLRVITKKETIKKEVKEAVWIKHMCPYDNRIAQCFTCNKFVRYPESLKYHYEQPHIEVKYKKQASDVYNEVYHDIFMIGCAEFGHVISERNGGKATVDNLVIQCKKCNTHLNSKNLTNDMKADVIMVDASTISTASDENINSDFSCEEYKCSYINKTTKKQCNNHRLSGRMKCQTHLYS